MSELRTITDEESILRISGTFGSSKTVSINNFGGITYIHLKCPKKSGIGWKSFTMSMTEYRELVRMAGPNQLATIAENFEIQNSRNQKREEEALRAMRDTEEHGETSSLKRGSTVKLESTPLTKKMRDAETEIPITVESDEDA